MGCEDAFKTRLAMYKFEGNALAWWKAYKQAKGGDSWLITVANAARNYEILHERDDDDAERPDKRRVVIGISRPLNRVVTGTTVIIMTVMDHHRSSNNNYSGNNNKLNCKSIQSSSTHKHDPNITTPGECRRAAGTCLKCGQAGHLQKDCKKNISASTSGQADKKP
nr:zinc finger, CCHC-type, retrotransposon Gag domain protein [Tanacetum cinerariifolium]